jgi:hypothetical protein
MQCIHNIPKIRSIFDRDCTRTDPDLFSAIKSCLEVMDRRRLPNKKIPKDNVIDLKVRIPSRYRLEVRRL